MVLPAGVSKICYLDLKSFLKLRALIKNKFGVEGREKFRDTLFDSWLFDFDWLNRFLLLLLYFSRDFAGFILVFFQFSLQVFPLVLVKIFPFKSFFDLGYSC